MGIMRLEGPTPNNIASFRRWASWTGVDELVDTYISPSPKDKPLGSHMIGSLETSSSPRYPHYDWVGS